MLFRSLVTAQSLPDEDDLDEALTALSVTAARAITITPEAAGERLDRVLAASLPDLSRARIQALMAQGALSLDGAVISSVSDKARVGTYQLVIPAAVAAEPRPQDLPLTILYEDAHLIVIDKAAGMAVHPAPGTLDQTLVNALLFHCAGSLSGIGGVARPGIVHRLDKDTSGVMVAAKTDAAHAGLSALFATHTAIEYRNERVRMASNSSGLARVVASTARAALSFGDAMAARDALRASGDGDILVLARSDARESPESK